MILSIYTRLILYAHFNLLFYNIKYMIPVSILLYLRSNSHYYFHYIECQCQESIPFAILLYWMSSKLWYCGQNKKTKQPNLVVYKHVLLYSDTLPRNKGFKIIILCIIFLKRLISVAGWLKDIRPILLVERQEYSVPQTLVSPPIIFFFL